MRFGRCAIVRFRFATVAAFLMLRRAAVRCFAVAMVFSFDWIFLNYIDQGHGGKVYAFSHLAIAQAFAADEPVPQAQAWTIDSPKTRRYTQ